MTTIGKYRHFSHVANEDGHFVVMAIDHRSNMQEKLSQLAGATISDAEFVAFKRAICDALMPHASAILADPAYAIAPNIAEGFIAGRHGLLAPVEVTDYHIHPSQRSMNRIPQWSVKKNKMMGGDGIKSLLPYNPKSETFQEKIAFVQSIMDDCATYDIPFFLEPIPYALDPSETLTNEALLEISIEMCQRFSAMGVDSLKLPFPVNHKLSDDETQWREACEAITEACRMPWALLSAGVTYDTFLKQSEIACQAGASGVIVGRAVWAEAVELSGHARQEFLQTTAANRMQELADVCKKYGTPWQENVQQPDVSIHWYESYQE